MKNVKSKIYTNASIVTALSVAERGLGFLYRIVLSRLISAEGLGLYQVALSLFGLFVTIGTGGIPLVVSRMITKSNTEGSARGEYGAVGAGLTACLLLTLPVCLFFWIFGEKTAFLFSDERSFSVFRILLTGLCCTAVYAVIRGSFWGNKEFLAPSVMEILEESVMVIVGVLLLQRVATPLDGAKKAAWAVVASYFFSCTLSLVWFCVKGGKVGNHKGYLKPLFASSLPITSVRASASLVNSAVAVLLPVMLIRAGLEKSEALELFGVVSGMVLPILFIPSTLIGSLALVLVPELSEDFYAKRMERLRLNLSRGLKFSFFIACFLIPFFVALGDDLGRIAFSNATAGEMIKNSAVLLLPMSITMITSSMLNSMGHEKQTFIFFFVGAAGLLLSVLLLPPLFGGYAYIIGLGVSYALTALCNLVLLFKTCPLYGKRGGQVFVKEFLPPLCFIPLLSVIGLLANSLFNYCTGEFLSMLLTGIVLLIASLLSCLVTGTLSLERLKEFLPLKKSASKKVKE